MSVAQVLYNCMIYSETHSQSCCYINLPLLAIMSKRQFIANRVSSYVCNDI